MILLNDDYDALDFPMAALEKDLVSVTSVFLLLKRRLLLLSAPLRRGVVTIKGMLEDQIVQLSAASAIPSFLLRSFETRLQRLH